MKYCEKCGSEMLDDAVVCVKCGCAVQSVNTKKEVKSSGKTALTLGICGIAFSLLLAIVGHICSIAGIVVGGIECSKTGDKKGLMVSIIGEVLSIISSVIGVLMLS